MENVSCRLRYWTWSAEAFVARLKTHQVAFALHRNSEHMLLGTIEAENLACIPIGLSCTIVM